MRSLQDCRYLAASVITAEDTQLALLFGLLAGEYLKQPDSLFWEVITRFLEKRADNHLIIRSRDGS